MLHWRLQKLLRGLHIYRTAAILLTLVVQDSTVHFVQYSTLSKWCTSAPSSTFGCLCTPGTKSVYVLKLLGYLDKYCIQTMPAEQDSPVWANHDAILQPTQSKPFYIGSTSATLYIFESLVFQVALALQCFIQSWCTGGWSDFGWRKTHLFTKERLWSPPNGAFHVI